MGLEPCCSTNFNQTDKVKYFQIINIKFIKSNHHILYLVQIIMKLHYKFKILIRRINRNVTKRLL